MTTALPRLPSGRVDWQPPSTRRRLLRALREGVTLRDLAARVGVTLRSLQHALIRLDLDLPPAGEVFLSELAGELGLSLPGTHALLRRAGIPMLAWGGRRTVRRCDVAHLLARPPVVRVAPPELCTGAQMAEWAQGSPATARRPTNSPCSATACCASPPNTFALARPSPGLRKA